MNGKAVITLPKGGQFVTREISFTFSKDRGRENNAVNLYPEITYQSLDGFGGSATEAAGYVLRQLGDAPRGAGAAEAVWLWGCSAAPPSHASMNGER